MSVPQEQMPEMLGQAAPPNLEVVKEDGGGMWIGEPLPSTPPDPNATHFSNLTETIDEGVLKSLASDLMEKVEEDKDSRAKWEAQVERALGLLGVGGESDADKDANEDEDRSNHTLLLKSLIRFQSQSMSEMLPVDKYVNAKPVPTFAAMKDTAQREMARKDAEAACRRVERFYHDYLDERLPTYVEEHDLTLFNIGLMGAGFKKVYQDREGPLPVCVEYVPTEDLIISYNVKSMRFGRVTHRIPMPSSELMRHMDSGRYRILDVGKGSTQLGSTNPIVVARDKIQGLTTGALAEEDEHELYEVCCDLLLKDDPNPRGLLRPYVVTIHVRTEQVLALRRNWKQADKTERRIEAYSGYILHPGKSVVYGMGLGDILSNITESLRKGLRRGLDAAYKQNHPFGFKKSDFTIRNTSNKIMSGELVDVETPAERISDAVMVGLFQGPSQGLIQLMEMMEKDGRELGGIVTTDFTEMMRGETPVGTAVAAIEENSKFHTAVHRRLYRGLSRELKLIHENMRQVLGGRDVPFGDGEILQADDLNKVNIMPAMRPGQASRQRRILEAQAGLQASQQHPNVSNEKAALLRYYDAMGVENPEDLIKQEEQAKPADPVTEMNMALQGQPLAAGITQHHDAHINAHVAALQMLQNSQVTQDKGEVATGIIGAHIVEHWAKNLALQVASMLNIPVEAFEQGIPPEVEYQIAPAMAQAIQAIKKMTGDMPEEDVRLTIEKLRHESKEAVEKIRQETAQIKIGVEAEIAAEDRVANVQMNSDDNTTALQMIDRKGEADCKAAKCKVEAGLNAGAEGMKGGKESPNVSTGTKVDVKGPTNNQEPSRGLPR